MRAHLLLAALLCALLASRGTAQGGPSNPYSNTLIAGDYLRVSAGVATPVNAQGSLRDWRSGTSIAIAYENWQPSGGGASNVGFGIAAAYEILPLKSEAFLTDFTPTTGGVATSATASHAGILEINSTIRYRFPTPLVTPALTFGLGFLNWAPGKISYTTSTGETGTAKQQHRSGFAVQGGASIDRQVYDRFAIFGEAAYVYGFTSFGRGFVSPGSTCASNGCDVLKNTSLGTIRGGLRVRMGR